MLLPHADLAVVPPEKISEYLLNLDHPYAHGKAVFFLGFGFTHAHPDILASALKEHARNHAANAIPRTAYGGVNYEVRGQLRTPDGRNPAVCSVWYAGAGQTFPRLVTAYAH